MADANANRRVIIWETQARQGMALASQEEMDDAEEIYGYAAATLASEYESWRENHSPDSAAWEDLEPPVRKTIQDAARKVMETNQKGISDQLTDVFDKTEDD